MHIKSESPKHALQLKVNILSLSSGPCAPNLPAICCQRNETVCQGNETDCCHSDPRVDRTLLGCRDDGSPPPPVVKGACDRSGCHGDSAHRAVRVVRWNDTECCICGQEPGHMTLGLGKLCSRLYCTSTSTKASPQHPGCSPVGGSRGGCTVQLHILTVKTCIALLQLANL